MKSRDKTKVLENLTDSPIKDESQDRLRRIPFIKSLYEEITNIPFEDSFCFGLYGGWGEGKTSVLNLLKKKLHKNQNIILFEFDPWYLASKEAILKNFLEGFKSKLRLNPDESEEIFKKYFNKLSSLGVSVLGSGVQVGWNSDQQDLAELKEKINSLIEKSKKKLVIFIDDVDRLQSEEILQVFKLVKLIADFKHTIFVLSMDVIFVKKALKSQGIDVEYIEKIVQKPVTLPKIEQKDIDEFFVEGLNGLFQGLNLNNNRLDEELENFSYIYQKHVKKLFITLRNVKRYINSLSASLPPIIDEVHLFDFIIIEILKVFIPMLYNDVYEKWWFYVSKRTAHEDLLNPFLWKDIKNDDEKLKIVKDHIETLLSRQTQKEVFINLLGILFPNINNAFRLYNRFSDEKTARQERRINSTSFLKYFMLRVPSLELPDSLINQIVSSWRNVTPEELTDPISEALVSFKKQDKLLEFFTKLSLLENIITPELAPALIQSIYQNVPIFSKENKGGWFDSEFHKADNLIVNLLRDKIEETKVQAILEEIMVRTDSLDFASGVYILCTQEQKRYPHEKWKILPIIRKVLVNRFRKNFIESQTSFFQTQEPGYILTRLWELCAEEENVDLKECTCAIYVNNVLENNPKHIGKFLDCIVQRWVGTKEYSFQLDINEVSKYLDINALYETIIKENENVYTTDEEKKSVDLFIKEYETLKQLHDQDKKE